MQKAVIKEGLRAPLFCLGAALLIAAGGTAAQTVEQSDLKLCARLETAKLKLACFEALAAIEDREAPPAAEAAPKPLPESAATEKALVTAGGVAVTEKALGTAGNVTGADDVDNPGRERPDEVQADLVDDPGQEIPDEIQVDVADEIGRELRDEEQVVLADEIGREHLDEKTADDNEKTVVRATVSEVVKGGYDVLYFHFANGQVWRQIESHRFSYPRKGEFDVIINTGMMGDYRLRLETGGPMIRIRRVK